MANNEFETKTLLKRNDELLTHTGSNWEFLNEELNSELFKTKGMSNQEQDIEYIVETKEMDFVTDTENGKIFKTTINLNENFHKLL